VVRAKVSNATRLQRPVGPAAGGASPSASPEPVDHVASVTGTTGPGRTDAAPGVDSSVSRAASVRLLIVSPDRAVPSGPRRVLGSQGSSATEPVSSVVSSDSQEYCVSVDRHYTRVTRCRITAAIHSA
jgi:hypothetical protein